MKLRAGLTFELPVAFTEYTLTFAAKPIKVEGEEVLGYCHYAPRVIKVRYDSGNVELVRATAWHEFFHAVFRELGRGDLANNEMLVDGLALAVMRVRLKVPEL